MPPMIPTEAEFLGVLRKVIAALDAVGIPSGRISCSR
jgi:hypothetical protein